ncbi:tyrosine-type recombinase/integrase [Pseudomonas sp. yb_2]|uniref:tyrosine-type recombinase/integrase n=1 Tax=Pseudomonas sp. yb_2 TaxID=3367218 RepID=UPI00370A1F26
MTKKEHFEGAVYEDNYIVGSRWKMLDLIAGKFAETQVSQLTKFVDNDWDFRKEGAKACLYLEKMVKGNEETRFPILILLKILMLALSGLASVTDKSGGTIYNIMSSARDLITWLVSKGYLTSIHKGGYFKAPCDLLPEDFAEFIALVDSQDITRSYKFEKIRLLKEWWGLSRNEGVLPQFLKLSSNPFGEKNFGDFFVSTPFVSKIKFGLLTHGDEESGWAPIPLDYAFPLADAAASYIENYGEGIIRFHQVVYEGVVAKKKSNSVTRAALLEACAAQGITLEKLGEGLPFKLDLVDYSPPSNSKKNTVKLKREEAETCIKHMKRAAMIVILFVTGARSRELANLKVGCCQPDYSLGVENFYRLTVTIFKTSREYSKGQVLTIPVPEIAYKAVKVLEGLNSLTRLDDLLLAPMFKSERGRVAHDEVCTTTILNAVKKFASDIGLGYLPHPHQFRKTIAGWFVMNSPVLGPLLVMRLFSHKSLSMTEMYLRNNPLIREARQEMLAKQSLKVVSTIAAAVKNGKLAGPAGERFVQGVNEDPVFLGITGEELGATMEEYLRERVSQASMHFLLTPLSICVYNPSDESQRPCARLVNAQVTTPQIHIRHNSVDQVPVLDMTDGLPVVDKCVGAQCGSCLITHCESQKLEQSLKFYEDLIAGAIQDDYSNNIYLMRDAQEFVRLYAPILEQIK